MITTIEPHQILKGQARSEDGLKRCLVAWIEKFADEIVEAMFASVRDKIPEKSLSISEWNDREDVTEEEICRVFNEAVKEVLGNL